MQGMLNSLKRRLLPQRELFSSGMWCLRFDTTERESRFLELALEQDVLFKRGAYNYAAIAHDEQTLIDIEHAASSALVQLVEETQP